MIQVESQIKIGLDTYTIKVDVENEKQFFEKISFFSNLPKTGPNGETDLKIVHRTTTKGYNYYSLVSEKAGMEFKYGQVNDATSGALYPKGWSPIYKGDDAEATQTAAPRNSGGLAVPVGQLQGTSVGVGGMPVPQQVSPVPVTQQVQSSAVQQPPVQQVTPTTNPQVKSQANDVLARFGIKAQ